MGKGVLDRCCGRRNFAHAFVRMVCDARALGRRPNGVLFLAVVVLAGAIGVGGAFAQSLTVDKMSFGSGQTITVSGTGFAPGVAVRVWFDSNGDSVLNPGESSNIAGVNGRGAFSGATLLPVGNPGA